MKLSKMYEQRKNLIIDSLIEHGIYKFNDYGHLYEVSLEELEEKLKEITSNHTEA